MTLGTLTGYDGDFLYYKVPAPPACEVQKKRFETATLIINDSRKITAKQRNAVFALVRDITDWICAPSGSQRSRAEIETLRQLQLLYLIDYSDTEAVRYQLTQHYCGLLNIDLFSLSDVDMTTARDFIDWLVELCVVHGIPCIDTLLNRCEDIGRYIYSCLMNKRCCITGRKAQLHHVDAVGRGRNRKDIIHLGMRVLPLSAELHQEAHSIGQKSFEEKYHVAGIVADDEICKAWGLKYG